MTTVRGSSPTSLSCASGAPRCRRALLWLGALLLALPACETEEGGAARGASGGVGPSTLRVQATITATNRVTNATAPDDFDTTVRVTVQRDGATVPDAIVSLRRADREAPDVLVPDEDGTYVGDHVGYVPRYELAVEAGTDTLADVRVLLPDVHVVTAPAAAARVPAGAELAVTWDALVPVDEVEVAVGNQRHTVDGDPDTVAFPAAKLQALLPDDEAVHRELTVTRRRRIALEGGAAGSRATAAVTNGLASVQVTP